MLSNACTETEDKSLLRTSVSLKKLNMPNERRNVAGYKSSAHKIYQKAIAHAGSVTSLALLPPLVS